MLLEFELQAHIHEDSTVPRHNEATPIRPRLTGSGNINGRLHGSLQSLSDLFSGPDAAICIVMCRNLLVYTYTDSRAGITPAPNSYLAE